MHLGRTPEIHTMLSGGVRHSRTGFKYIPTQKGFTGNDAACDPALHYFLTFHCLLFIIIMEKNADY